MVGVTEFPTQGLIQFKINLLFEFLFFKTNACFENTR